jgi:hypothetical protein
MAARNWENQTGPRPVAIIIAEAAIAGRPPAMAIPRSK